MAIALGSGRGEEPAALGQPGGQTDFSLVLGPLGEAPALASRVGSISGRGMAYQVEAHRPTQEDQVVQQQPDRGDRGEQRVEPVHQPAVARDELAHVLDAEVALDHRLDQVAQRGHHHRDQAEGDPDPPATVEQQTTRATPAPTQDSSDPAKPSQDFFGEITGAIGCRPNSTPAA